MSVNRSYNYKNVDMLLCCKTISGTFKNNIEELSQIRSNWSEAYADDLLGRADDLIENQLGIDKKKELRDATAKLSAIQMPAMRDLSFLKTQIDVDYSNDKPKHTEFLRNLGFTEHLSKVQKKDQQAIIKLLYQFKTNLTAGVKADIVAKGVNPALLDKIVGYANELREANVTQESLKTDTKSTTQSVQDLFNGIYDEVIGICKIASNYYQYDELKKEQFTFSKVVSNLSIVKEMKAEQSN